MWPTMDMDGQWEALCWLLPKARSVSYTHLDVYKRQAHHDVADQPAIELGVGQRAGDGEAAELGGREPAEAGWRRSP